ncbi:MAG TPA: YoaK family protein [Candidatus Binataceae bacterium]|jgi:uncharacterized membrane protein YoaK (UPF0700 family)|nr:YoaK family protein [Candidatus Binataceae bacterium]
MQPDQRDRLLMLLAITSGSADGWSYVGLGHAFVANMTGNTVLLGVTIFTPHHAFAPPLLALFGYILGVALGAVLTPDVAPGALWDRAVSIVLLLEAALLSLAAAGWMAAGGTPHGVSRYCLLGVLAVAIGLQSGAMLALKLPGIVTTYITGTWTTLVSGLGMLMRPGARRLPRDQTAFEERLALQAVFLIVYFLAAIGTGLLLRHLRLAIGALCATPTLLVALYGLRAERATSPSRRTTP